MVLEQSLRWDGPLVVFSLSVAENDERPITAKWPASSLKKKGPHIATPFLIDARTATAKMR